MAKRMRMAPKAQEQSNKTENVVPSASNAIDEEACDEQPQTSLGEILRRLCESEEKVAALTQEVHALREEFDHSEAASQSMLLKICDMATHGRGY